MRLRNLLYYVHHHGSGHFSRYLKLRSILRDSFNLSVLTSNVELWGRMEALGQRSFILPDKWEQGTTGVGESSSLPRIPMTVSPLEKNLEFLKILKAEQIDHFLSDVSAELTILARMAGVESSMMVPHGRYERSSLFKFAFGCCSKLYFPFPELGWVHPSPPGGKKDCLFLGFPEKVDGELPTGESQSPIGIVIGHEQRLSEVVWKISAALPERRIIVYGNFRGERSQLRENVRVEGVVERVPWERFGPIVVCSGGNNVVGESLANGKYPLIVPEYRPFCEQLVKASLLGDAKLARVVDESADVEQWAKILKVADNALNQSSFVDLFMKPATCEEFVNTLDGRLD